MPLPTGHTCGHLHGHVREHARAGGSVARPAEQPAVPARASARRHDHLRFDGDAPRPRSSGDTFKKRRGRAERRRPSPPRLAPRSLSPHGHRDRRSQPRRDARASAANAVVVSSSGGVSTSRAASHTASAAVAHGAARARRRAAAAPRAAGGARAPAPRVGLAVVGRTRARPRTPRRPRATARRARHDRAPPARRPRRPRPADGRADRVRAHRRVVARHGSRAPRRRTAAAAAGVEKLVLAHAPASPGRARATSAAQTSTGTPAGSSAASSSLSAAWRPTIPVAAAAKPGAAVRKTVDGALFVPRFVDAGALDDMAAAGKSRGDAGIAQGRYNSNSLASNPAFRKMATFEPPAEPPAPYADAATAISRARARGARLHGRSARRRARRAVADGARRRRDARRRPAAPRRPRRRRAARGRSRGGAAAAAAADARVLRGDVALAAVMDARGPRPTTRGSRRRSRRPPDADG